MPEQRLGEVMMRATECAGGWAFLSGRKESFALSPPPFPCPLLITWRRRPRWAMSAGHATATVLSQEGKDDSEKNPSLPVNSFIFSFSTPQPSVSHPVIHDWPLPQSHFQAYLKCRFLGLSQTKSETLKPESWSLPNYSLLIHTPSPPYHHSHVPPTPQGIIMMPTGTEREGPGQEWDPLGSHLPALTMSVSFTKLHFHLWHLTWLLRALLKLSWPTCHKWILGKLGS